MEREGKIGYRSGRNATEQDVMDYLQFISHLKLTFVAEKPPPSSICYQEVLMAAAEGAGYF